MSTSKAFISSLILLIIGGLNWGLIGFFNFDLVASLFGTMTILSRMVYAIVGIAAVIAAITIPIKKSNQ